MYISLGHFIFALTLYLWRTFIKLAAAIWVILFALIGSISGFIIILVQIPPKGDDQTLPNLPFPPNCFSDIINVPSTDSLANVLATSLVEVTSL